MNIRKCKVGMIVKSKYNDLVKYKIIKINKESIDILSLDIMNLTFLGQDPDIFNEVNK